MSYETINIDQVQRVAIITMNRPEVLNALNVQLVREVDQALTNMEEDEEVGAIIITGAGEAHSPLAPTFTRIGSGRRRSGTPPPPSGRIYLAHGEQFPAHHRRHQRLCYGGGTVMATSMDF